MTTTNDDQTDPTTNTDPTDPPTSNEPPAADNADDAAKWKALARKHEDRAKANAAAAKELEALKASMMSDQEKAIAAAVAAAKADTSAVFGGRLVAAEFRAAAAGRNIDVNAVLDAVDAAKFLADDGTPDTARIVEWVNKVAPKADSTPPPPKDFGQGARQPTAAPQITDRAALKTMTPDEIVQARKEGRLNTLMGITT